MSSQPGPQQPPQPPEDEADTAMFRAFADGGGRKPERPKAVGVPFRLLTLAAGLVVFVLLVWLVLLR